MTTPQPLRGGGKTEYAFGWVADTLGGRPQIWHNGGVLGAGTRNCWFPRQRLAVIAFANTLHFDSSQIVRAVMRIVDPPSPAALVATQRETSAAAPGEDAAVSAKVAGDGKTDGVHF